MKTKSRKIRIYPTQEQRILFKQWFGVSRKFYNESVSWYNQKDKDTINWMEIAKRLTHQLTEDYIKYAKPLIMGELTPIYTNGLPTHLIRK